MSYSCSISFKQLPLEEVQQFLRTFKQCCTEHLRDIAKDEWRYVPYIRRNDLKPLSDAMDREAWRALSDTEKADVFPREFRNVDERDIGEARGWMRSCVFYFRYAYDSERQLLTLFGVPDAARAVFDGTVYFQNSCDQDYERSEYKGIKPFEDIWDKWNNVPEADILKYFATEHNCSLYDDIRREDPEKFKEEFDRRIAYYRRDAAYNEIWKNYEHSLYDDTDSVYLGLYNGNDIQEMNIFLKACHDACVNDKEQAEIEWVEACIGMRPAWFERIKRFAEASGGRCDAKEELQRYLEKNPAFLEKYPQYKEACEAVLHFDGEPARETDDEPR